MHFRFLQDVQKRLAEYTENCMRISHTQYRTFETEKRSEVPNGFIDGDLIESILDTGKDSVGQIVDGLKMPLLNSKDALFFVIFIFMDCLQIRSMFVYSFHNFR